MTSIQLSHPESPYKRFYRLGNIGISYNTVEEIAKFLTTAPVPEIATYEYSEGMIQLANVHAAWGDYKGMRENLNFLVDVRIRVAELRGEKHTS